MICVYQVEALVKGFRTELAGQKSKVRDLHLKGADLSRGDVALGSAARVAALLFWQQEWLLLWSSSVVWWLEELLVAVYSRTCGFSTHSESHLILCNEYLSVSAA